MKIVIVLVAVAAPSMEMGYLHAMQQMENAEVAAVVKTKVMRALTALHVSDFFESRTPTLRGSQTKVHVPPGVHFDFSRGTLG